MRVFPFLQLARPANVVTAAADVLLGAFAARALVPPPAGLPAGGWFDGLGWLIAGSCALYAGGVVMNDVFDAELDRSERPERPIPSERVTEKQATLFGCVLLFAGIAAAAQAGGRSAALAGAIAALALTYDAFAKHHPAWGPFTMGACRSLNLLLGFSVLPLVSGAYALALLPLLYIAAITLISRGEVGGGNRRHLYLALAAFAVVVLTMLALLLRSPHPALFGLPFILLFVSMVFPPLLRAIEEPGAAAVGRAVRTAVLALIVFDAALGASLAGWAAGLLILALLPVSLALAAFFEVT